MKKKISKVLNILLGLAIIGFIGFKVYKMPKFSDGEVAPGFEAKLLNGKTFSLSELEGSYVLIDFWGSWCGPCRVESPKLVELHNMFNGESFTDADGFEIVSVAIETNEGRWIKAIEKDKLNWPHHIVQLDRFKGPIATKYGVKEIPTKYLLDTKGEVLMVNPPFEKLTTFLKEKQKS